MAESYDGEIKLAVSLTPKDVRKTAQELQKEVQQIFSSQAGKEQNSAFTALNSQMKQTVQQAQSLADKLSQLENKQIPTQEYTEISQQIEKANREFDRLLEKQSRMEESGKTHGKAWDALSDKMDEVGNSIRYAEGELQDLVESGKAFTLGRDTEEFTRTEAKLDNVNDKLKNQLIKNTERLRKEAEKTSKAAEKGAKKVDVPLGKIAKKILAYGFGIRSLYVLFRRLRSAITEGFKNLIENDEQLKQSIESLKGSLTTVKNSLASAFAPIVSVIIPYIQQLLNWIVKLLDYLAQFNAAIMGQKAYKKAVDQSTKSMKDAAKAAKGYLSPIDTINKMTSDSSSGAANDAAGMFEDAKIDPRILSLLDTIKEKASQIRDIFKEGFIDGFGTHDFEGFKKDIDSIKKSLIGIYTDPEVIGGAATFGRQFTYTLGQISGAVSSIGTTIAINLVGGIEKYLKQNIERIKNYIVSMFDIGTRISEIVGNFSKAVAEIFSVFESDEAQQLTANLIGIFSDAFMGITELVSKLGRDILDTLLSPITDNTENIKTALQGLIEIFERVTGGIKEFVDYAIDEFSQLYDEHLKGIFDSLRENFTLLIENITVLWNTVLKPFLDWLIDTLGPILMPILKTLIDVVVDIVGTIATAISGIIQILSGIIEFFTGVFSGDWDKAWSGIERTVEGATQFLSSIIEQALALISGVLKLGLQVISGIVTFFAELISKSIQNNVTFLKTFVLNIVDGIKNGATQLLQIMVNNWITLVTNLKNSVVSLFQGMWDGIKGVINSILGGVERMANGVIDAINSMIEALNGLSFDLPDWVPGDLGGESFGLNIPTIPNVSIPRLAQGMVVPPNEEFLAMLGDNKKEQEIVSPLSTIERALENVLSRTGGKQSLTVNLQVDRKTLAQAVIEEGRIVKATSGKNMFSLG